MYKSLIKILIHRPHSYISTAPKTGGHSDSFTKPSRQNKEGTIGYNGILGESHTSPVNADIMNYFKFRKELLSQCFIICVNLKPHIWINFSHSGNSFVPIFLGKK